MLLARLFAALLLCFRPQYLADPAIHLPIDATIEAALLTDCFPFTFTH